MSEANKDLVRSAYKAINSHDFTRLADFIADDLVEHEEAPGFPQTKDGTLQMFQALVNAFPDLEIKLEDMAAEGDKVFVRATMSGTQKGEFMGIPPSGKSFSIPMGDFVRIVDGHVVEHWGASDSGAMLQQLGVIEMPGA